VASGAWLLSREGPVTVTTLTAKEAAAGSVSVPAAYVAAAEAKLQRDRESYRAFRAVDQELHEARHKTRTQAELELAKEDLPNWRNDAVQAKAGAADALAAAREAEDEAREAAEFAVQAGDAYRKIKDTGSPQQVTEALTAAQNARKVAEDRRRAAEAAAKAGEDADALLVTARDDLAKAETWFAQAKRAAEAPAGTAPYSEVTIAANFAFMQRDEVWDALSRADQKRVTAAAREVRAVPATREEFEVFKALMDASMTAGARREAARIDNGSIGTPLLRPVRVV